VTRSCARRTARRDARPHSGVRQIALRAAVDCDPPPFACGSTKLVVTGLDAASLSLGVAGDFGCKLRSRYLVLVLEQPFHALCSPPAASSAGTGDLLVLAPLFRG
jgi:hypothetical protein